mgnify:CR=1 FL=1
MYHNVPYYIFLQTKLSLNNNSLSNFTTFLCFIQTFTRILLSIPIQSIYIDYRHTLNFPHTIQALIPFPLSKPHQKPYTPIQNLHTLSKMYLNMFFSLFFLLKTEINTQTFYSTLSTVSLSIISHNSNIFKSLSILIKVPLQYFSIPSSLINCSSSFLFIVPATV